MKANIWWVVVLESGIVGQLYVTERSAHAVWKGHPGATYRQMKLVPVKSKKKSTRRA